MSISARPRTPWSLPVAMLLALACLILSPFGNVAAAAPAGHAGGARAARAWAVEARTLPPVLNTAAVRTRQADRVLVADAKALKRCLRRNGTHNRRCNGARNAVQSAGTSLALAQRRLARIARATGRTGHPGSASALNALRRAPLVTVDGQTLRWTRVAAINTYVLASRVPGQAAEYLVVSGDSITPPPVPGKTVAYSLRTTTDDSMWSADQTITYPPAGATADTQTAPALSVSGRRLSWADVADVSTYVLRRDVSGRAAEYSVVSGTSVTPTSSPGATVGYSVRTAVDGSAWSPEVAVSYPTDTPGSNASGSNSALSTGPFEMGIVSGSAALYELPFIQKLGAHTARVEISINTPVSQIESTIAAFAQAGVRVLPLAGFEGSMPSPEEAQNVASWAERFGPGGSFWQGKSYPAGTAVTDIEFGNETSYPYQYSDNSPTAYAERAQTYALRFAEAATAIRAVAPQVGLLAQGDSGGMGPQWVNQMFRAVPNLGQLVAGWTIHPYGPEWRSRIDELISTTQAAGAPSNIPIYVTEWGLDSDNGRCLEFNFGWNKCMSYSEAAGTLGSVISEMKAAFGSRLAAFYLFQAHDQKPTGTSTELEAYFGAQQSNGDPKGPYTGEVESLLAANP